MSNNWKFLEVILVEPTPGHEKYGIEVTGDKEAVELARSLFGRQPQYLNLVEVGHDEGWTYWECGRDSNNVLTLRWMVTLRSEVLKTLKME